MTNREKDIILDLGLSNGDDLEFVCKRRNGGVIFLDKHKDIYIKIGDEYQLKREYDIQKYFIDLKFQVASIISSYKVDNYFVYTENKLGDKVIGQDISEGNIEYSDGFKKIFTVAKEYFIRQSSTINSIGTTSKILEKNNVSLLEVENLLDEDTYIALLSKLGKEIDQCEHFGLVHGDFNSMNLFETGIIDLEDSYNGIIGFDLITLISHHYWFEINGIKGRSMLFSFDRKDIEEILTMFKGLYDFDISKTFDLCFMLRSIWSTVGMGDFSKEQRFRLKRLEIYIRKYLNEENLLEYFLYEVDTINHNKGK